MKWISNKTLFNIHGWLGLNLGLLLFVICFSGTFATLSYEVDWLLNADMRIEKQDRPIRWEAMHTRLQQTFPEGRILSIYKNNFSVYNGAFATTAYMSLPDGQNRKVYLNPYSGEIQGHTSFFNVQRFFRSYHRRFFDGERGIFIITFSSFFLLFSALTGFLFYKGWLKNLFKLRIGKGIKNLFSDVHKLAGIWSLLFVMLIALTGIFYFTEVIMQAAGKYDLMLPEPPAQIEQSELATFGPNPALLPLDTYVKNAQEAYPGLDIQSLRVPHSPSGYVYIDGQAGNPILRDRANKVYLHPYTGEVVHIQRSSDLNAAEFITDAADPLHFGYFGGLSVKILWFVLGLALSFAILSGTYLWYVRGMDKMERRLERIKTREKDHQRSRSGRNPEDWLAYAGFFVEQITASRGAVISTTIILLYLIYTGVNILTEDIRLYGSLPEERFTTIETVNLGPWEIDLRCEYPCNFREGTFIARFKNQGISNYASLSMDIATTDGKIIQLPFQGYASNPTAGPHKNLDPSEITNIQIVAESLDGDIHSVGIAPAKFSDSRSLMIGRFKSHPERRYPEVSMNIYIFIGFFGLCTIMVLSGWTYYLVRSTSKQLKLQSEL